MSLTYSPTDFALLMEKYKGMNISEGYNERDFYGRELFEDIDVLTVVKEFFDHGLKATTICQGEKNAFDLFLDAIYEGHRYALEDGGREVKSILALMLKHGGEECLPFLIEDLKKVIHLEVNSEMIWEEFISTYGLYSRAFVFGFLLKELKIDPVLFFREKEGESSLNFVQKSKDLGELNVLDRDLVNHLCSLELNEIQNLKRKEWEMAEAKSFDDFEDSISTTQKILEIFKGVVEEYWESDSE